jgi:hypothetical protein
VGVGDGVCMCVVVESVGFLSPATWKLRSLHNCFDATHSRHQYCAIPLSIACRGMCPTRLQRNTAAIAALSGVERAIAARRAPLAENAVANVAALALAEVGRNSLQPLLPLNPQHLQG